MKVVLFWISRPPLGAGLSVSLHAALCCRKASLVRSLGARSVPGLVAGPLAGPPALTHKVRLVAPNNRGNGFVSQKIINKKSEIMRAF